MRCLVVREEAVVCYRQRTKVPVQGVGMCPDVPRLQTASLVPVLPCVKDFRIVPVNRVASVQLMLG